MSNSIEIKKLLLSPDCSISYNADDRGGAGVMRPPLVSKLSVLELSEKTSRLLSMGTRDWWCVFYPRSLFDPVVRGYM